MFSKACEYGIKAAIFIAINSFEGKRVSPKEIAEEINSPQAFTAKILQALARNNIVYSIKGAHGGFELDKKTIGAIKLAQIVKAIDGDSIYNGCGLGLQK
ncbi:MAG TPA: Rrf2 family transcriptional regulator, partial [Mariniflexile sp.]|nr:Rrf2 family transcriptional regulator [Mariniflexile sp.]